MGDKCAVVQTSLGWQSPWTPTGPGRELNYCKLYSDIKAALNKFEERLGLTAREAIPHPKMSRTCLRLEFRRTACCTKFFHVLLQCGKRFPGFPENLKSLLFCNTCGILNFMLIYKPLVPPRMLRMTQHKAAEDAAISAESSQVARQKKKNNKTKEEK